MQDLTEAHLRAVLAAPHDDARPALWFAALNASMAACAITGPVRQAAFLAQVLTESSQLHQLEEVLYYQAARLRQVWPSRFPSDELAESYSQAPERLGNYIYANRMGNGDEASGDGWRYRGRGLIQLTGRSNYAALARAHPIDALGNPDLLLLPPGAALSASWFWHSNGLNELADRTVGADADSHFAAVTRRVNGDLIGLAQRRAFWARAQQALA